MIGADLLKEELKGKALPTKKHFIAVFDSPKKNHITHVGNLISGKGSQAVLPSIGDKQSVFRTEFPGDFLAVSELLQGHTVVSDKTDSSEKYKELSL